MDNIGANDYVGDVRRPHRLQRAGGGRRGHHGRRTGPRRRARAGRHRPRDVQGRPARDDRALRADGRPGRDPRHAARPQPAAGPQSGASPTPATTRSSRRSTGPGSRCSTRSPAPTSSCRRPATWPACGRATTTPAACTRRRRTRWCAERSTLQTQITKAEHDLLNPVGINCVRSFPGRGVRVWGARTLSSDAEWRYLNVRRLFNYLEESILLGTQWVVFEPNDHALWARIRRTISCLPHQRVAQGRAVRHHPRRGVLRQVRRRDQPGRGHRRRPGRVPDRRGAGEARRVRHLPAVAVLRRHQPRIRIAQDGRQHMALADALDTPRPTASSSPSTGSRSRRSTRSAD